EQGDLVGTLADGQAQRRGDGEGDDDQAPAAADARGGAERVGARRIGCPGGVEQRRERHEQRRAQERGEERGDEAAGPMAQVAQGHGDHAAAPIPRISPRWARRSATASAVGAVSDPAKRPSAKKSTESAYADATGSCVTMTTVPPCSCTTARSRVSTSRALRMSSAPVGSSAKMTAGSVTSARATATRWR